MSEGEWKLRRLTQALLLSASIGAVPVSVASAAGPRPPQFDQAEQARFSEALQSAYPPAVEEFILAYPMSRLIPQLLNTLPIRVVGSLSVEAVTAIPRQAFPYFAPQVREQLRAVLRHAPARVGQPVIPEPAPIYPPAGRVPHIGGGGSHSTGGGGSSHY